MRLAVAMSGKLPGTAAWDCDKWHMQHPDPPWTCWHCGDEINRRGQTLDSLAVHHINGYDDREALAPVHMRCHNQLHAHSSAGHVVRQQARDKISAALKGRPAPHVAEANRRRVRA